MNRRMLPFFMASLLPLLGELLLAFPPRALSQAGVSRTALSTVDLSGELRSLLINGSSFDLSNPFFKNLGTNGRSCISCHVPADGWTISPARLQSRFLATGGLDPVFRPNDGANSPL